MIVVTKPYLLKAISVVWLITVQKLAQLLVIFFTVGFAVNYSHAELKNKSVVHIFAASSMAATLGDFSASLQEKLDIDVQFSLASSAQLAKQIEQGAPADIFISAHPEWIQYLQDQQRLTTEVKSDWLGNDMILVQSFASDQALTLSKTLTRIGSDAIKGALADPDYVPSGRYAKKLLQDSGYWEIISPLVVPAGSAQNVLQYLQQSTFSWGVLYQTDWQALADDDPDTVWQKTLLHPQNSNSDDKVQIGIAIVKPYDSLEIRNEVQVLYDYLQSYEAMQHFSHYGFRIR
jgi:molybdate transport system substrate-binding protein